MVPRPSAPKIRHSLWHRLLRLRKRRHAHQTQVQIRRRSNQTSQQTTKSARRQRASVSQPELPVAIVPWYVHVVRLLILVLGASVIVGTGQSMLQSMPNSWLKNFNQKHNSLPSGQVAPQAPLKQ